MYRQKLPDSPARREEAAVGALKPTTFLPAHQLLPKPGSFEGQPKPFPPCIINPQVVINSILHSMQ